MLSRKQNFIETLKINGRPDRLVNQYEALDLHMPDPMTCYIQGERYCGMEPVKDKWGVTFVWQRGDVSALPLIAEKTKAIRDVTSWRDFVKVPDIVADCSDQKLWIPYLEHIAKVDREDRLVTFCAVTGIFERLHFLMGFEDTLCNFLLEPEAMADLCEAVAEYRLSGFRLMNDIVHPDAVLSHDDWGSKSSLFMSPETWRRFIRPGYRKCYDYLKKSGVILIHHSDSYAEPLAEDMAELGIDVWQGALPQNDIVRLQERLHGKMTIMGGIDAGIVDRQDSTEAEIREETRRACRVYGGGGHYIPCITYGGPSSLYPGVYDIISDEIERFNLESRGLRGGEAD